MGAEVLLIGLGSIAQRRVLPSLLTSAEVDRVHIADIRETPADALDGPKAGKVFNDPARALAQTPPCFAYISVPNALHYGCARAALEAGFHVMVDKPAFLTAAEAGELAGIAADRSLCLAEANVWQYHPMARLVEQLHAEEGKNPIGAHAIFTSPPLEPENFRLQPAPGNGIVYDRGSYAISAGRVVFRDEPVRVACTMGERDPTTGVDLTCVITLKYPCGGLFTGLYSLKADYRNSLTVVGGSYSLDLDRVFTPPPDYEGPATIRRKGVPLPAMFERGNTFGLFIDDVIRSVRNGTHGLFAERCHEDAKILDAILYSSRGHR